VLHSCTQLKDKLKFEDMINRFLTLFLILILINGCSTNPTKVSGEDAQKILATQFGTIVDVQAVTIKGKKNQSAAAAGALIGGLAGNLVEDGKYREILIATGAIIGGVVGYYAPVKVGEHNGFQYVISIDDKKRPVTLIQGGLNKEDKGFEIGQRVTIVYSDKIRVLPGKV
tara:strand:+ start:39 stop:551 length:513 start_codon:yes stop_codon:yes gene_type:complete